MKIKQKITSALLALLLLVSCLPSVKVSAAETSGWDTASEGQRNIVRRAYQMREIRWTPKSNITGWRSEFTYKAGTTYTGLPYSQPLNAEYVPWDSTLEEFLAAVNDSGSSLYQTYKDSANGNITMPYYGTDCSAYVGWAWGVKSRGNCSSLLKYCTLVSSSSYEDAQIGDALIRSGHAALITDITYDASGNITSIEVCDANANEATYYCCQRIRYGKGGTSTLEKFQKKFFVDKPSSIYRYNNIDSVTYTHSCAVPLEGDTCRKCGLNYYSETACSFTATVDVSATVYDIPTVDGAASGILFAGDEITVKAYHIDDAGTVWYKTTDDTWVEASRVTPNCAHSYTCDVTKEPTCTAAGTGIYTCSACMHSYTDAVRKLGHSYQSGTCIRCGATYEPGAYLPGDVDLNGAVDTDDAVYLLLHIMFGDDGYPVAEDMHLDFNGSQQLDTDDAVYLLLHIMFGDDGYPL